MSDYRRFKQNGICNYKTNEYLNLYLNIHVFIFINFLKIGKRACRFPGDPKNGRVTPVKFLYELGDRILIQVSIHLYSLNLYKLMYNGLYSKQK